jgi:hypothetical protein
VGEHTVVQLPPLRDYFAQPHVLDGALLHPETPARVMDATNRARSNFRMGRSFLGMGSHAPYPGACRKYRVPHRCRLMRTDYETPGIRLSRPGHGDESGCTGNADFPAGGMDPSDR